MKLHAIALLLLPAVLLGACSNDSSDAAPSADPPAAPSAAAASSEAPPAASTEPHPDRQILAPGAVFVLPADWVREPPDMAMRLAQASIPGAGGPGQLTVFHFGAGGGGPIQQNLDRWVNQVEAEGEPKQESFTLGSWKVTWVEVAGTLKPSSMGVGPTEPQPNSRLLGAVVEGEGGPWFFKATGPSDTLDAQRDAFLELLKSGRPHS